MMPKLRILVVDDHPLVRSALSRMLSEHLVWQAEGYDQAAAVLASHDVDLVLTDYDMPGPSGVDVLLTAAQLQPLARRILMSGNPPPNAARLLERGVMHACYWKPCVRELLAEVDTLVARAA
jgi:CheY-like chemotaxis protein